MQKWLTAVGPYRVEHMPMRHPAGQVDLSVREGVLHTIEGSLESGLAVFRSRMATPHFTVGRDRTGRVRVIQHVPLGEPAAALKNMAGGVETNFEGEVQIEIADRSRATPWLPEQYVTDALAELLVALRRVVGIPLTHPFPDNPGRQPWATTSFSHRRAGKWGRVAGWYGHMDVPENDHWDCGWLRWSTLLAAAQGKDDSPVEGARITEADWEFGRWHHGLGEFADFGPRAPDQRPAWYPQETPAGGWAAARWYQSHVVNRRRLTDIVRTRSLASAAKRASPAPLCNVPEPT